MYSPSKQNIDEFHKHQEILLPHTRKYIGRTNLDIGCGNGLTSIIHQRELGISPTLCDIADIRDETARSLPFYLLNKGTIPINSGSFESSYLQYVLHHLPSPTQVGDLLAEAARVSDRVIIVEEIRGSKTDVARAKIFDQEVNDKIHQGVSMPVYNYYSATEVLEFFKELGSKVVFHHVISEGSEENGFLETRVFVTERPAC